MTEQTFQNQTRKSMCVSNVPNLHKFSHMLKINHVLNYCINFFEAFLNGKLLFRTEIKSV